MNVFKKMLTALLVCTMMCTTNVGSVFATEGSDPETGETEPEVKNGWIEEDGGIRYYVDNKYVTGIQTIEGKNYYFNDSGLQQKGCWIKTSKGKMYANKSGTLKNGLVMIGSNKYYFKSFIMQTGNKTISGDKYYFKNSGVMFTGVRKSNKKLYCYKENGKQVTKKGFFTYKNDEYYCLGKGVLATGWKAITRNKKLNGYYFYKSNGKMAKNKKIGHLKIPKSGKLHEAYALGIQKLNSTKWTLKTAYNNSKRVSYYGQKWRQKSAEKYALRGFKEHRGNCYVMASMFYIQAKLLGYNVRQCHGYIGPAPHSWTQIKHGKKWYVYDPEFQHETGRNGWKFKYGRGGTWRYSRIRVFQK